MSKKLDASQVVLRFAKPKDAPKIVRLIKELAEYEKDSSSAVAKTSVLKKQMTSRKPPFECVLAERGGNPIGFALFFTNYSTWQGKPGMYLEDLFVAPTERSGGTGKKLLKKLGEICRERGYGRMEWQVLNWNKLAIDFYDRLGAKAMSDWTKYRLEGDALHKL